MFCYVKKNKTKQNLGLPWWRSGQKSACQCRGHGFNPWSGKIPHAAEQLSPWATTTEPVLYSPRATTSEPACHIYWSPCVLEPMCRNYWSPHTLGPACHNYWAHLLATTEARVPRAHAPQQEATAMRSPRTATKSSPRSPHYRKPTRSNEDPMQPKVNK